MELKFTYFKFGGTSDFAEWQCTAKMALRAKGAIKAIKSDLHDANGILSDENKKIDETASYMLNTMLNLKISRNIESKNTFEIWNELTLKYAMATINKIVGQVQKLLKCHMEPEDIDGHMYWDLYHTLHCNIQFDNIMCGQLVMLIRLVRLNKKFVSINVKF
ncbi:hypothetical protein IW136_005872, partial [Coemansia sp. RSA 678]